MKRSERKRAGALGAASRPRHRGTKADSALVRALCRWFAIHQRDLPWRKLVPGAGRRDPYLSLVSEIMLQQTQVSRVLERFEPFVERFPTVTALAGADEDEVLAAWSGMGYYRRARLLHRAARAMREHHMGEVPAGLDALGSLPGVGRYTAGAVASICFGLPAPIVDGNIRRVLMRLEGRRGPQTGGSTESWAWARAGKLVQAASELKPPAPGTLNEALMELGATVCTPQAPRCGECPIRGACAAFRRGLQDQIPLPRPRPDRKPLFCVSMVARDGAGRLLVERRPESGLWAGMWQAPTAEGETLPPAAEVRRVLGGIPLGRIVARFDHGTTHREVKFLVRRLPVLDAADARRAAAAGPGRKWAAPAEVASLALSNPQSRILLSLGVGAGSTMSSGKGVS